MSPWIYFLVTAAIAWHGITHRDANGEYTPGHLLFGCIALTFALRFLFVDIMGLPVWGIAPLEQD